MPNIILNTLNGSTLNALVKMSTICMSTYNIQILAFLLLLDSKENGILYLCAYFIHVQ